MYQTTDGSWVSDQGSWEEEMGQHSNQIGTLSNNAVLVFDSKYKTLCPVDGTGMITDWSPAINQAIADGITQKRPIQLPYGDIPHSQSINVTTKVRLMGFGKILTTLRPAGAFPSIIVNGTSGSSVYYWELVDLGISGSNGGTIGVQVNYAHEGWMRNCRITGLQKGLTLLQSWSNGFENSQIMQNTDTNVELGDQSNDVTFIDCQLDQGGNYGLHITADSQSVSLINCVVQLCGKDGVLAGAGKAIHIIGGYYENNNSSHVVGSADIHLVGDVSPIEGVVISGTQIWSRDTTVGISLDKVAGCAVIGGAINLVGGGTTLNSIQSTTNTTNVITVGLYTDQSMNDVGNAITDFNNPIFRKNIGVKKNASNIYSDTLDATTATTLQQYIAGILKTQIQTDIDGQMYLSHRNTTSGNMETVMNVNNSNRVVLYKTVDLQSNNLVGAVVGVAKIANTLSFNNSFFVDSADNVLKFKDNSGAIRVVNLT